MYPTYQVMRTRLFVVNDQRLALGEYIQVGGSTHPFIYDLIYKKFTPLTVAHSDWNRRGRYEQSWAGHGDGDQ